MVAVLLSPASSLFPLPFRYILYETPGSRRDTHLLTFTYEPFTPPSLSVILIHLQLTVYLLYLVQSAPELMYPTPDSVLLFSFHLPKLFPPACCFYDPLQSFSHQHCANNLGSPWKASLPHMLIWRPTASSTATIRTEHSPTVNAQV
ncbi:hypothetical protein GE21DRAFT_1064472 [Neurospora crassa]|nr:hypothetical protein GE21DRAFT_1064472 [Neurospora crassa]